MSIPNTNTFREIEKELNDFGLTQYYIEELININN